jgi:hypothetical protein
MDGLTRLLDRIERVHLFVWLFDFIKWPKAVSAIVGGVALAMWAWAASEPWPVVIFIGLITALAVLSLITLCIFLTEKWKNSRRSSLEIVLELRVKAGLYGPTGERLHWGVKNNSRSTIYGVSLRAKESFFTRAIIAPAYRRRDSRKDDIEPIVAVIDHIDPFATETKEALVFEYLNKTSRPTNDILSSIQHFSLEARARDQKTVINLYEYNPDARPMFKQSPR